MTWSFLEWPLQRKGPKYFNSNQGSLSSVRFGHGGCIEQFECFRFLAQAAPLEVIPVRFENTSSSGSSSSSGSGEKQGKKFVAAIPVSHSGSGLRPAYEITKKQSQSQTHLVCCIRCSSLIFLVCTSWVLLSKLHCQFINSSATTSTAAPQPSPVVLFQQCASWVHGKGEAQKSQLFWRCLGGLIFSGAPLNNCHKVTDFYKYLKSRPNYFNGRPLQCGFWPRNSQILIGILLWIFGWICPSFFPRKKAQQTSTEKSPAKFTWEFVQKNSPRIPAEAFS